MHWLILATVCQAGFALSLKGAGRWGAHLSPVGLVNYAVAGAGCGLIWWLSPAPQPPSQATLYLGALTGVGFVVNYMLIQWSLKVVGIGISAAIMRVSVVIPVVGSVIWFDDRPTALQWAGIALAVPALIMLSWGGSTNGEKFTWLGVAVLVLLFVNTGLSHFALKAFRIHPDGDVHQAAFITVLFSTSAVGGFFLMGLPRGESAGAEWFWGAVVGVFNIGGTHGMVNALALLPASQAFPLNTIAGIALTSILAVILFKERLGPAAIAGLVLAAAAGTMISIRP